MASPPGAWVDDDVGHGKDKSYYGPVTDSCTDIFFNFYSKVITPVRETIQSLWSSNTQHSDPSREQYVSSTSPANNGSPYRELHPTRRARKLSLSTSYSKHDEPTTYHAHHEESVQPKTVDREIPYEERAYGQMNTSILDRFRNITLSPKAAVEHFLADDSEGLRISQKGKAFYKKRADDIAERIRLAKEAEEARIRAEEAAKEAERIKREGGRRSLAAPFILDRETYSYVAHALAGKRAMDTITTASNGTEIAAKDCMTLWGKTNWLNDEIVNTQLGWICLEANKRIPASGGVPAVAAMPSFFYTSFLTKGYQGVARWARKQKIGGPAFLKARTVLVPINNASHWTLLVISPRLKKVEYFDSLGGSPSRFFTFVRNWLSNELGKAYKAEEWTEEVPELVQQTNGYDCGVFLLTNAELCSFGINPMSYMGRDMPAQRLRIACILLDRGFGKHAEYLQV